MKTLNFNFPEVDYAKVLEVHGALMEKAPQHILDIAVQYFGQSETCNRVSVKGFLGVKVLSPAMATYSPAGIQITPEGAYLHMTEEFITKLLDGNEAVMLIVGHEYGHMIDMANTSDVDVYELDLSVELRCDLFAMEHFKNVSSLKLLALFNFYLEAGRNNIMLTEEQITAFEAAILPRIAVMEAYV